MVLRTLSENEQSARNAALLDAGRREVEARKTTQDAGVERDAREAAELREREQAEVRKREEDDRRKREEDLKRRGQEEAARRLGEEQRAPRPTENNSRFDAPRSYSERPARLDGPRPAAGGGDRGPRPEGDRGPVRLVVAMVIVVHGLRVIAAQDLPEAGSVIAALARLAVVLEIALRVLQVPVPPASALPVVLRRPLPSL